MELKKQTLIIIVLSLIVVVLGGLYAMNIGHGKNPVEVNVTVEQPKPAADKSDELRKGEFIPSEPASF